jgi:TfoX/Sxy family transcriptional regulator of competence genes
MVFEQKGRRRVKVMPISEFDEKHKEVLDSMLLEIPGVKAGKMFGLPGYYINGKLFACLYEEGVAMKAPDKVREKLMAQKDVEMFVPMGKHKMKEWVLINKKDSKDYLKYEDDFISSLEYVLALSKQAPKKKKKK